MFHINKVQRAEKRFLRCKSSPETVFISYKDTSRFLHINCFRALNCTLHYILKLIISDINSNFHPKTHNLEILFPNVFIFTFIPRAH